MFYECNRNVNVFFLAPAVQALTEMQLPQCMHDDELCVLHGLGRGLILIPSVFESFGARPLTAQSQPVASILGVRGAVRGWPPGS